MRVYNELSKLIKTAALTFAVAACVCTLAYAGNGKVHTEVTGVVAIQKDEVCVALRDGTCVPATNGKGLLRSGRIAVGDTVVAVVVGNGDNNGSVIITSKKEQ